MIEPCAECIVHFILKPVSTVQLLGSRDQEIDLYVWEVSFQHAVHDSPHVCNGIFVFDANLQLIPDERPRALPSEQIFGPDRLVCSPIDVLQLDFHRIFWVFLLIRLEPLDCPWPLYLDVSLVQVGYENSFNQALVQ